MANDDKLWKICLDIYRKMYKEAEPSADFDELNKLGITKKDGFFNLYYLSQERQEEIIKEVLAHYKIKRNDARKISVTINLGCSPNTCKEKWEQLIREKKLHESKVPMVD